MCQKTGLTTVCKKTIKENKETSRQTVVLVINENRLKQSNKTKLTTKHVAAAGQQLLCGVV